MSNFEQTEQLLEGAKTCASAELSNFFAPVFAIYPLLSKEEKRICAQNFHGWSVLHVKEEPLKHGYGVLMLALNLFLNEEFELTIKYGTEAQQICIEYNDEDAAAVCASLLGSTYRTLGSIDITVLRGLKEGYEQLKKSGKYEHNFMACGYQIASIYVEMKNYDDALPLFKSTLELAQKIKNLLWINNALHGMAKVYLKQHKYSEAKQALDEGMLVTKEINKPLFTASSQTDLADYYLEIKDYKESERLNLASLQIRREYKYIGGAITNCLKLGEIYLSQSKIEDAIVILNEGLVMAQSIKVKPKMYQVHKLLSEVYALKNEPEKSLYHYRLFHEMREEVEAEDNQKKIKNLQLIFEAEQTRKENVIIKKQKQVIENKNIELQATIDELTRTKVGKKAKAFTLIIAIVLFVAEELVLHYVLHLLPDDNFYLSFMVKMVIIFSLKPIDTALEHYLLNKIIRKQHFPPSSPDPIQI